MKFVVNDDTIIEKFTMILHLAINVGLKTFCESDSRFVIKQARYPSAMQV